MNASIARAPLVDWRELAIRGMHYSGALRLARRISKSLELSRTSPLPLLNFHRAQAPRFLILCYHGIGESGNPLIPSPSSDQFDAQMHFLRDNYRVLSLEDLFRELSDPSSLEPGVAITFDDGYRSTYTQAFPILKKYQLPATIYLIADPVETGQVAWYDRVFSAMAYAPPEEFQVDLEGPWRFRLLSEESRLRSALEIVAFLRGLPNSIREEYCARLEKTFCLPQDATSGKVLNWAEIRVMQKSGVTFGSHTMSHPVVSQLSNAELERELLDSKRYLEEKLGSPVRDFAYPFGKASDCGLTTTALLAKYGYRSAVTTLPGMNTPRVNRFELRRIQVGHNSSLARFAFELARAFLEHDGAETANSLHAHALSTPQAPGSNGVGEAIESSRA